MAMVILGIAAAGVLLPFSSGASAQAEGTYRTLAVRLAGDLMERIVSTPRGEIIASWNGYVEPQGQVTDASGAVFTDPIYGQFSREIACDAVYTPQESGVPFESGFILASVRVYYQGRPVAALSRLLSR